MTTYGIESELTAQLAPGLLLRLPLSATSTASTTSFTSGEGATCVDLSGLPVNRCPEWTATADFNYTLPLHGVAGSFVLDASANYVSKNLDTYSIAQPVRVLHADLRGLRARSSMPPSPTTPRGTSGSCACIGKNLTDKTYVESSQNVDPLWVWSFYGQPRFLAAQAGMKF